ncbi:MAG: hypothetical protein O3B37_13960 [Proteobacteria bacterium]|nr:hypothetical protein [Pseudomonadota bacterium]
MRIALLRGARAVVMAGFAVCAAAFVGLSVYAVLQFGLWWPRLAGLDGSTRLVLAAVTMLPFLLLFTKLNWSRPLGWLSGRFNWVIEPIDQAIGAIEDSSKP